jgi:hypothetical protein
MTKPLKNVHEAPKVNANATYEQPDPSFAEAVARTRNTGAPLPRNGSGQDKNPVLPPPVPPLPLRTNPAPPWKGLK